MKKLLVAVAALATLTVSMQAAAADTVSWTAWNSNLMGSFVQNGNSVGVSYSGTANGVDYSGYIYDVPASFTNAVVTNTPGSLGTIQMVGGSAIVNGFHFDRAVIDPVMVLFSVGQGGVPVSFNFDSSAVFTIGAQGAGHWAGGSLTQSGNTVTGIEGNGLLQFKGSYTDINFTTPNYENYYGATVGAMTVAVPEPETYALMLAGLLATGAVVRRQRRA